ncbi:MAG: pectinesterase family protein [Ferruginibacter sp.]
MKKLFPILFLFVVSVIQLQAQQTRKIIVAKTGKADYNSIQAAINSLPDSPVTASVIFIRNGIYHEKIYVEKHNIILEGEDRDKTIITESIARDVWRCLHNEDWGVATLNVDGNDISLKNLTIINNYGFKNKDARTIFCKSDSTHQKVIRNNGHQMAIRTMNATRLKAINCHFKAFGGDTVSPWNVEDGLFYFKNCIMEGGVDFYCPRGWAWAEGCRFIAHNGEASIWHDGSKYEDSKTVLMNCVFEGYDGFKLGRYHRDAQFYLVNCSFAANMADKAIYRVPTNNVIQWGERIYYFNCHKKNGDFNWFADNLATAKGNISASNINIKWIFNNRWNPLVN